MSRIFYVCCHLNDLRANSMYCVPLLSNLQEIVTCFPHCFHSVSWVPTITVGSSEFVWLHKTYIPAACSIKPTPKQPIDNMEQSTGSTQSVGYELTILATNSQVQIVDVLLLSNIIQSEKNTRSGTLSGSPQLPWQIEQHSRTDNNKNTHAL